MIARWRREWGLLALVALLALPLFTPRLYAADEIKYFVHLRSAWFDHDLDFSNEYEHFLQADPKAHGWLQGLLAERSPTGRRLNDAPIGSAVLWAPFYLAADIVVLTARALGSSVARDGFSPPYVWAVCLGSLIWGMLGLALTARICRLEHSTWASQRAVLGVWLATSLVFYLYITPPMAHANSFFAVALFTWLWLAARGRSGVGRVPGNGVLPQGGPRKARGIGRWVLLGAAAGLMVLVRELNWLMLIPLGFDELWHGWRRWRAEGVGALARRLPGQAAFAATLVVVVLPQFLTYRALHGTYGPTPFVVEKFSPYPVHALEVLFSGFHGLYSWAPITLLATIGLALLFRRQPVVAVGLGLALAAQVLVIGSYSTWWGGASFGARRFINCTPIFAVGLAAVFAALPSPRRRLGTLVLAAFVVWNFGLAIQYATGMIPRQEPVSMRTIVRNQLVLVPQRAATIAWRFLTDRWSLVENPPGV